MSKVKTRFAPSPTGFLHIGGARTALFNWLYAMNKNGKFYLRIEDTDKARSTDKAIKAIFDGLEWLGLSWEEKIIFQSKNISRYREVVDILIERNKAYFCYASENELSEMKKFARENGLKKTYNGLWRDKEPTDNEKNIKPVVRFKSPQVGETIITDLVQGEVKIKNEQLDDMVLLRSDGTPTYMLSVVVDDYDMEISDVIRGDDHLNNALRQINLFHALEWDPPNYAHIPLIHDSGGKKLSKRENAVGVDEYKKMGILPEAMKNYLLRLGWSHGNDEIISENEAINIFSINNIGKSPSRFDLKKLKNINSIYLKNMPKKELLDLVINLLNDSHDKKIIEDNLEKFKMILDDLIERSDNLKDLILNSNFLFDKEIYLNKDAENIIENSDKIIIKNFISSLNNEKDWSTKNLEILTKSFAKDNSLHLKDLAMPLRASITGNNNSPNIFKVMFALGKDLSLNRLQKFY
ncbi:MAG: glutamate--tRNA ligase [Rhodospirillaceae bacterium]|nr:glutamate--tRNA ligase [Rhodospirillaceae bacterium]